MLQVVAAVLKSMQEEGRAAGLKGFEQVRSQQTRGHLSAHGSARTASHSLPCTQACPAQACMPARIPTTQTANQQAIDTHILLPPPTHPPHTTHHPTPPHCFTRHFSRLQVASIHLHPEQFSVENSMMTPTFKLKRPQAQAAFQEAIDGGLSVAVLVAVGSRCRSC